MLKRSVFYKFYVKKRKRKGKKEIKKFKNILIFSLSIVSWVTF
jgi:hypothetical protein